MECLTALVIVAYQVWHSSVQSVAIAYATLHGNLLLLLHRESVSEIGTKSWNQPPQLSVTASGGM